MKKDQLEALIIDNELGELPEEVSSLLDAYLATHTEVQKEAGEIREAMGITRQTVNQCPELFRSPANNGADFMGHILVMLTFLKSRNTAVAFALIISGALGFFLKGNYPTASSTSFPVAENTKQLENPSIAGKSIWASYRIDDGGKPVLLLASTSSQAK